MRSVCCLLHGRFLMRRQLNIDTLPRAVMTTDSTEMERVLQAIRKAWDDGCPVAGPPWEELARVALRRWDTFPNRGIQRGDVEARIRDLMKGLTANREADPSLVGPLEVDYEYLARAIGLALSPERHSA